MAVHRAEKTIRDSQIFSLHMDGCGPGQIARVLTKAKILNHTIYKRREGQNTLQAKSEYVNVDELTSYALWELAKAI